MLNTYSDITLQPNEVVSLYEEFPLSTDKTLKIQNKSANGNLVVNSSTITNSNGIELDYLEHLIVSNSSGEIFVKNIGYSDLVLSVSEVEPVDYIGSNTIDITDKVVSAKISTEANNELGSDSTGLFVPSYTGTNSIDITNHSISTKISSTANNEISVNSTGLYSQSYSGSNAIDITNHVISSKLSTTADNALSINSTGLYSQQITRQKNEVRLSGMSIAVTSTPVNLINAIKAYTPTSGTLDQFINTTSNKVNFYNFPSSTFFKLNFNGTWSNQSSNMSFTFELSNSTFSKLTSLRTPGIADDTISFSTFTSIDVGDNLVTNGTPIMIATNGGTFTITSMLIIIEQYAPDSMIISVA